MQRSRIVACAALLMSTALAPALAEPAQEGSLILVVPDAPTRLEITSDSVNANGKTKAPGEEIITRAKVEDANGLDDVRELVFAYAREDPAGRILVHETRLTGLDAGNASIVERVLEDRFALSPLREGEYVVIVGATDRAGNVTATERTFRITNSKPFLRSATVAPASVVPDAPQVVAATFDLADKNLDHLPRDPSPPAPFGPVQARLYRGPSLVASAEWELKLGGASGTGGIASLNLSGLTTRSAGFPYSVRNGSGAWTLPATVRVPAGAAAGTYRISLLHDAGSGPVSIGSATFTVEPLPQVTALRVPAEAGIGGEVVAVVTLAGSPAAVALATLRDAGGSAVAVPVRAAPGPDGNATIRIAVPSGASEGNFTLEVAAVVSASGSLVRDAVGTPLNGRVATVRLVGERASLALEATAPLRADGASPVVHASIRARGFHGASPAISWTLLDWTGAAVADGSSRVREVAGGVEATVGDLAPGRYTLAAEATAPDGSLVTASVPIDVGGWLRVALGAPALRLAPRADGKAEGEIEVANAGNAAARRLLVVVSPFRGPAGAAPPPVERALLELRAADGRVLASAVLGDGSAALDARLPPGLRATLRVTLPAAPAGLDAGTYEAPFRLVVEPEETA